MPKNQMDKNDDSIRLLGFAKETKENNGDQLIVYKATVIYNEIEFQAHLTEQRSGAYQYRGIVSAISPLDGYVVQRRGREGKDVVQKLVDSGKFKSIAEANQHRLKELNVSKAIYIDSRNEGQIKDAIVRSVRKLYAENAELLCRTLRKSIRPDTITPLVALASYVDEFLKSQYPGLSEKSVMNYKTEMRKLMSHLDNKPMAKIGQKQVNAAIKASGAGGNTRKRLHRFWQYLIDNGIVAGINPTPVISKRKTTVEMLQNKAKYAYVMDLEQQDRLYEFIMRGTVTGAECGVALETWAGIGWDDRVCWKHIRFDDADHSLAVIKHLEKDMAGATHDFSKPAMPFAARILYRRFTELQSKYPVKKLLDAPVISAKRNPLQAMSKEEFTKEATRILRSIGFPEEMFKKRKGGQIAVCRQIMKKTYEDDINSRCGLAKDEGTRRFLLGIRLNDVTSDAYTKFNDADGIRRMHTAQSIMAPLVIRDGDCVEREMLSDGGTKYTIYPEDSRRQAKVFAKSLEQLSKDVEIHCPHGVTGVVKNVPAANQSGSTESGNEKRGSAKRRKAKAKTNRETVDAAEKEEAPASQAPIGQAEQPTMTAAEIEKSAATAETTAEAPAQRTTAAKSRTRRTKAEKQSKEQEGICEQLSLFEK